MAIFNWIDLQSWLSENVDVQKKQLGALSGRKDNAKWLCDGFVFSEILRIICENLLKDWELHLKLITVKEIWKLMLLGTAVKANQSRKYKPPHDKTNKMACAPSEDSDQPGQINLGICPVWSVFAVCMKKAWSLVTHCAHSKDWSDWMDAKADLSLHWVHMQFCWFCHDAAHYENWCFLSLA